MMMQAIVKNLKKKFIGMKSLETVIASYFYLHKIKFCDIISNQIYLIVLLKRGCRMLRNLNEIDMNN